MTQQDIAIDLYCGLGGWAEGLLSENFTVIGFDIERHDYGTGGYPGQLVLQDVLTICGAQFKPLLDRLRVIVASPPCTEPSYRAMPWKRAKALNEAGPPHNFIALFRACFRIQREICEAAGRHIPLIVENVKGAQQWVGRAKANFGSFYLWGDVGMVGKRVVAGPLQMGAYVAPRSRAQKVPGFRFDGSGKSFQSESVKVAGQDWSRFVKTGEVSPHWRMEGLKCPETEWRPNGCRASNRMVATDEFKNDGGSWFNVAHNTKSGKGHNPDGRSLQFADGVKGFTPNGEPLGKNTLGRAWGSKSKKRKAASAMIAKIPYPLAQHIARSFKTFSRAPLPGDTANPAN
jgi:hypothetical protein